jgi:hypothetical protein
MKGIISMMSILMVFNTGGNTMKLSTIINVRLISNKIGYVTRKAFEKEFVKEA